MINDNNTPKQPGWIKIAIIAIVLTFVSIALQQVNANMYNNQPTNPTENTETTTEATVPSEPSEYPEMVGNMEYLGCNKNSTFVGNANFYYYRDIVTDVMYLVTSDYKGTNVTVMVNPETGLPLTHSQYESMSKAN